MRKSMRHQQVETELDQLYASGHISKLEREAGLAWADDCRSAHIINKTTKTKSARDAPNCQSVSSRDTKRRRYQTAWDRLIRVLGDELAEYVRGICIRSEPAEKNKDLMSTLREGLISIALTYGFDIQNDSECKRFLDQHASKRESLQSELV